MFLYSDLDFISHFNKAIKTFFVFNLRNTAKIRQYLTQNDVEMPIDQEFTDNSESCSQDSHYSSTPLLHWLPVCVRVGFKVPLLVYNALHDLGALLNR